MEKYIIAIAIVLSTIIYVFGNKNDSIPDKYEGVIDRFSGKQYHLNDEVDYVNRTFRKRKLKTIEEKE